MPHAAGAPAQGEGESMGIWSRSPKAERVKENHTELQGFISVLC